MAGFRSLDGSLFEAFSQISVSGQGNAFHIAQVLRSKGFTVDVVSGDALIPDDSEGFYVKVYSNDIDSQIRIIDEVCGAGKPVPHDPDMF